MMTIRKLRVVAALVFSVIVAGAARGKGAATEAMAAVRPFEKGDRWAVVGDSITHSGGYHKYVYLFYATRYPERRFEMWNCGVAGDQVSNVMKRASYDILPHKATVSTIMLGMNDVGRGNYARGQEEAGKEKRAAALEKYSTNMRALAEALSGAGSRLVFLSPTPFDDAAEMAEQKESPQVGINVGLVDCMKREREIAAGFSAPVVDVIDPMMALTAAKQKVDPRFTLVRSDRVHPEPPGHFFMAYWFLKAQGMTGMVSRMGIDAAAAKAVESENCAIDAVTGDARGVAFSSRENALPFPTSVEMLPALAWVPFVKEMDQEVLRVAGLASGRYRLEIDGEAVAEYSAEALAAGVNLATETKTPQYRQAVHAMELNDARDELERTHLRSLMYVEKQFGRPTDANDTRTLEKAKAGKSTNPFVQGMYDDYAAMKPAQEESEKKVDAMRAELWEAVKVKAHAYRVVRVDEAEK